MPFKYLMNSKVVKNWFKTLNLFVSTHTVKSKAGWIVAELPFPGEVFFPMELRMKALQTVYPDVKFKNPEAGNVTKLSITMLPAQWEILIKTYENTSPSDSLRNSDVS